MTATASRLLEQDHRGISELFERVHSPDTDRASALRELLHRLVAHVAVEQSILLPEIRDLDPRGGALADQLREDHRLIEHNLVLIERRKANSPDQPQLVSEVLDVFDAHVERCRTDLYPLLDRHLDPARAEALASQLREAENVVLTHPHPHLLHGPQTRLVRMLANGLDRFRGLFHWGGLHSPETSDNRDRPSTTPPPWSTESPAR